MERVFTRATASALAFVLLLVLVGCGQQPLSDSSQQPAPQQSNTTAEETSPSVTVPESNRTTLDLYASPTDAYQMWEEDPQGVHFLDVRTFEEYIFGGHVLTAKNVPYSFPRYDPEGETMPGAPEGCSGEVNPEFVSTVSEAFDKGDTIMVMCGTGGRAAMAVNALADAGFTRVYNVVNGFEGETIDDPASAYDGKHMKNGWKNEGLPWGYEASPDLVWVEPAE